MNPIKKIKITRFKIFMFIVGILFIAGIYVLASHIGFNSTKSVNFTFYFHTDLNGHMLEKGDYVLFKVPQNELYKEDMLVVKRIACLPGHKLQTYNSDNKIIYSCDGAVVDTLTKFTRPNGELLKIFTYDGIIPEGYYFLIGDYDNSYDGKYWGLVEYKKLLRFVHPIALSDYIFRSAYAAADDNFYAERNKGWYKYEIEPIEDDNKTKDNDTFHKKLPKPIIPSMEELSTMPTEKFATLFKEVQDYAMSYRTLENFDMFAKMRSVMVARAMEFTNVATLWSQLNPEDTTESWFPTSGFGQDVYRVQAAEIRMDYIKASSNDYGLIYFYRLDCGYCQKEAPIIKYFEDKTGWSVKWVNTDEMPEAMLRFGIQTVPSIILLERESKKFMPLASGLMTYEEIEDRLYRTIKYLKGESDEKNFSNPIRPNNFVNK